MYRDIDIDEISDGSRYHSNDLVKVGCRDCEGCSECCRDMDRTIILDPYDIYMLTTGLGVTFDELIGADVPMLELNMADGIVLPNIKMQSDTNACGFLNDEGRCSIHKFRSGFCRMFPLGRIYENGSFSYFLQIDECKFPDKVKVKVKKWLGIDNLGKYESFVLKWHDLLENARKRLGEIPDQSEKSKFTIRFLHLFYKNQYDSNQSFYEQFESRINLFLREL